MNTDRELMQQALEMIEDARNGSQRKPSEPVITALRERLAQPNEFEPDWDAMAVMVEEQQRMAKRIAELEAQLKQEPVAWQRIETAPKTGRKVILFYLNRNNLPRTVMARWLSDDEAAETDTDCVGLEGGWYECIDNWDDYTEVAIHEGEPTYWMPLPPAPTAKGKPDAA